MEASTPRAARPARGEELELQVESLAQGGRGVARRADGFVVFVAGGLPGDRVRARVSRSKRGYAEADKLRRRAGVGGGAPITGYETLNATQVKARLKDLSPADLRKVRTQEKRGKARKGVLDEIEKRLSSK